MTSDARTRRRAAGTVSGSLPLAHRAHALGMLLLPAVATAAALVGAVRHGVSALDVSLLVVFYSASAIGISVGFHRLLAHGAFEATPGLRRLLAILGCMAGQGPPLYWVANHRRHHDFSDQPGDPHSPYFDGEEPLPGLRGFLHAHAGWTLGHELTNTLRYCPDLLRDRDLTWVGRRYFVWFAIGLLAPGAVAGVLTQSWTGVWHGVLWGGFVRLCLLYHVTLAINSLTHLRGNREFEVSDHSGNVVWLALPSFGESWHNNHHAFPSSAHFGLRAMQVDLGACVIELCRWLGLVRNVRRPSVSAVDAKRRRQPSTNRSFEFR